MHAATIQQLKAKAHEEFPEDFKAAVTSEGMLFAVQNDVFHERSSGGKLHIGYVMDNGIKVYVWAVVTFGEGIAFYKNGERFSLGALKLLNFDEPMRTLASKCKDRYFKRLRSFIYFMFMEKGLIGRFNEGHSVTFDHFKYGCQRIASAKRNGFYGMKPEKRGDEVDDEGYNTEDDELGGESVKVKRARSNENEQGHQKRVRPSEDSSQSAIEKLQHLYDELHHEHQVLQASHDTLQENHHTLEANHQILGESHQVLEKEIKRYQGTLNGIKVLVVKQEHPPEED